MICSIEAPAGIVKLPALSFVSFFISTILFKNACESEIRPCVLSEEAIELAELPAAIVMLRSPLLVEADAAGFCVSEGAGAACAGAVF